MATLGDGLKAFYDDLSQQGMLNNTLVLVYSEFGRRISENGSQGTDHGAGANMMVLGGLVRGGIYGTAAEPQHRPRNPTLENSAGDVKWETDFRSVYAKILDNWLGVELGVDPRRRLPRRRAEHPLDHVRATETRRHGEDQFFPKARAA